ncbi:hypothetical protein BHE74_00046527 [Ensete ventricosum]|nr:hypothetical protein BHE74_00046527 [Ensete ventricosum]RZS18846.1 hypothetical protein BHM03_00051167 [Ensete ventricosum]
MTGDSVRGICGFAGEEGGDGSSGKALCAAVVAAILSLLHMPVGSSVVAVGTILRCCTRWWDRGRLARPAMSTACDGNECCGWLQPSIARWGGSGSRVE